MLLNIAWINRGSRLITPPLFCRSMNSISPHLNLKRSKCELEHKNSFHDYIRVWFAYLWYYSHLRIICYQIQMARHKIHVACATLANVFRRCAIFGEFAIIHHKIVWPFLLLRWQNITFSYILNRVCCLLNSV